MTQKQILRRIRQNIWRAQKTADTATWMTTRERAKGRIAAYREAETLIQLLLWEGDK